MKNTITSRQRRGGLLVVAAFGLTAWNCTAEKAEPVETSGQPTATTTPTGALPPEPGVLEPSGAFGTGNGPNPNTIISANPIGCQGEGETYPGGTLQSCYRFVNVPSLNWAQASVDCTLWSAGRGHLVAVSSALEQEFLRGLVGENQVWLGASDAKQEGSWKWLSGETWFYENFGTGKPDDVNRAEHCLSLTQSGSWDDASCERQLPYVCERPYGGMKASE